MNFSHGPGLVAAIASTINRTDMDDVIRGWIVFAESDINRVLRTQKMVKKATTTFTTPFQPQPTDFIEMQSMNITTPYGPKSLRYLNNEELDDLRSNLGITLREPTHFQIAGEIVEIAPFKAPVEVEMRYYAQIPTLNTVDETSPAATNWLLRKAPQAYYYAALLHAPLFLFEDERAAAFSQMAQAVIEGLNTEATNSSKAGSRLNMTSRTFG